MATETRVFESVDASPEVVEANKAYFAEQGVTIDEVKTESDTGDQPPAADKDKKPAAAAAAAPAGEGEGHAEGDDTPVDAETAADWESAQTDGKRKSRYAKERLKRRETLAENERLKAENAALKAPKPEEKKPTDATASNPATPATDATAAETFSEPEPKEPQYEDFANEDDQLLAFNKALTKFGRDAAAWDRRRERFEEKAQAAKTRRDEEATTAKAKNADAAKARAARVTEDIKKVTEEFPDFEAVVQGGNVLSRGLQAAAAIVPDGVRLAYLLAKDPAKLKQFNEMTAATVEVNGETLATHEAYQLAIYCLGQVASSLPAKDAPAGTPAATPSSQQPREEPPATRPARGRSAGDRRREDITDPDERRDLLAADLAR